MPGRLSKRVLLALVVLVPVLGAAAVFILNRSAPSIRHVILFVGDGMQLEHEVAASRYLYGKDDGLAWHAFPYQSYVSTWDVGTYDNYAKTRNDEPYDASRFRPEVGYDPALGGGRPSPLERPATADAYFLREGGSPFATDSASSATAVSTGYKTDDGNIAWLPGDPEGGRLTTIAERLRAEQGFAIGVVSTVPFTHATPASHVSHNVSRGNYHQIAQEIVGAVKPDVVIGGGHPDHTGTYMAQSTLEELRADPGWVVVERKAEADGAAALLAGAKTAAVSGKRLFGLFGGRSGNFESPVPVNAPGAPAVTRPTAENPLLEHATVAALEVLSRNPNGFFVMIEQGDIDWANHDHDYARMIGTMWDLDQAVRAALAFVDRPGDDVTWENTVLVVTADHANSYMRLNDGVRLPAGALPAQERAERRFAYPGGEVTYGVAGHTNELVTIYAQGARRDGFARYEGAWYPCTRIIDNTQIFNVLAEATGLAVRSPLQAVVTPTSCQ